MLELWGLYHELSPPFPNPALLLLECPCAVIEEEEEVGYGHELYAVLIGATIRLCDFLLERRPIDGDRKLSSNSLS